MQGRTTRDDLLLVLVVWNMTNRFAIVHDVDYSITTLGPSVSDLVWTDLAHALGSMSRLWIMLRIPVVKDGFFVELLKEFAKGLHFLRAISALFLEV
jgi:hypothetical protein